MNKQVKGRKFGRVRKVRKAFMRSLAVSLVESGKIKTTEPRAKELRPYIEKMVTKAKKNDLANRKRIIAKIGVKPTRKLFDEIGPKYKTREGGYTRITKLPARKSDASKMAIIEFV